MSETTNTTMDWDKIRQGLQRVMAPQMKMAEAATEEWSKLKERGVAQAQDAMRDYSKLMRSSMEYNQGLWSEWGKLSMDTMRQAMSAFRGEDAASDRSEN